jgi:hypothetical protein
MGYSGRIIKPVPSSGSTVLNNYGSSSAATVAVIVFAAAFEVG